MELIDDTPTSPVDPFPRNRPIEYELKGVRRNPANLVVFEGPDGVGKSTVVAAVAKRLTLANRRVLVFSLRGSELIHHAYRRAHWINADPVSMNLIDWASAFHQTASVLHEFDSTDCVVIFDRYAASAYVRGAIDGVPKPLLDSLAEALPRPGRVYFLSANPTTCWQRLGGAAHGPNFRLGARYFEAGRDRLIPEGGRQDNFLAYQSLMLSGFRRLADETWVMLDAARPVKRVIDEVVSDITAYIEGVCGDV